MEGGKTFSSRLTAFSEYFLHFSEFSLFFFSKNFFQKRVVILKRIFLATKVTWHCTFREHKLKNETFFHFYCPPHETSVLSPTVIARKMDTWKGHIHQKPLSTERMLKCSICGSICGLYQLPTTMPSKSWQLKSCGNWYQPLNSVTIKLTMMTDFCKKWIERKLT